MGLEFVYRVGNRKKNKEQICSKMVSEVISRITLKPMKKLVSADHPYRLHIGDNSLYIVPSLSNLPGCFELNDSTATKKRLVDQQKS